MRPLPLRELHRQLGASLGERAGWEVPLSYGDVAAEYEAVRRTVGIADISSRSMIRVTGEDRLTWLQGILSNDLRPLSVGQGVYSGLLSHKGKMLAYVRVYALPEQLLIEDVGETGGATFQALRKFLLYGTKAKMQQATDMGLVLVSGPRSEPLLATALRLDAGRVAALKPLSVMTVPFEGHDAWLLRTEETGEFDVEIALPVAGLPSLWTRLLEAGAPLEIRPFGAEAREILRIEAGLPWAGLDLTEEIVPPEANLEGKAFSLSKGCYPGQEVVARMDTYGSVRRRLVGLLLSEAVAPVRGAKLYAGDREVGWVSSAARSPGLHRTMALGFPLRDFSAPGTTLAVDIDGRREEAVVHLLPFYSRTDG
jgi:folate-binding protein YgfZ